MSAKDKAQEIYCKYADTLNIRDLQTTANPFAKQCAIICVDEIINYLTTSLDVQTSLSAVNYWYAVKQEIEKL